MLISGALIGLGRASGVAPPLDKFHGHHRKLVEAEKRQGKLRALPELVPVVAKEGKKIRAGETRSLYLGGLVHHLPGLGVLDKRGIEERSAEKQMREWDPGAPKRARADDRIDWIVHAIHALGAIAEEIVAPPEDVERDTDWGEESRYASVAYEDRGYR